jgi:hypothetical protein
MMKKLLALAFLLVPAVARADTGDIPLSSNFQQNSGRPLDAKIVTTDSTSRNAIPGNLRYDGMIVYQRSDRQSYQLQGDTNTWVPVATSTSTLLPLANTWTGQNLWVATFSTFTHQVTMASVTLTDANILDFAERLPPTGVVGAETVYADSVTHTLRIIPNGQEDYAAIMSSITAPTAGDIAAWSAYGKLRDMGPAPWVIVPSTFSWRLPYPVIISSSLIVSGGSTTITAPMSLVGFSTETLSNEFFDLSNSTTAVGMVWAGGTPGTLGQFLTSGGVSSSATWTTVSGGGGASSSPVEVIFGVSRTSPTATIIARTPFTGSVTGSTITLLVDYSSFTMQGNGSNIAQMSTDIGTNKATLLSVGLDTASIRSALNSHITSVGTDTTTLKTGLIAVGVDTGTLAGRNTVTSSWTVTGSGGIADKAETITQASTGTAGLISVSPSPGTGTSAYLWELDALTVGAALGYIGFTTSAGASPGGLSIFNNTKGEMMRFGNSSAGILVNDAGGMGVTGPFYAGANVSVVSSNYVATTTDTYIAASAITTTTTITLDAATTLKGQQLSIFKVDGTSWPVTVVCAGTDKINGSTGTFRLDAQGQSISITSDGTSKWLARNLMATPIAIPVMGPTDNANSVAQAASTTVLSPQYVPMPVRVTGCRFVPNVSGGMVDCNLYDSNGALVSSTTVAALGAGSTVQVLNFITPITLSPGTYYPSLSASSPSATFKGYTCLFNCSTVAANMPPATTISLPGTQFPVATAFPRVQLIVTGGASL